MYLAALKEPRQESRSEPLGLGNGGVDESFFQPWLHLPCSLLFALTPFWHMNSCVSVTNHGSGQGSDPAGFLSFPLSNS